MNSAARKRRENKQHLQSQWEARQFGLIDEPPAQGTAVYHFTQLCHLPEVMEQGLTTGELAGTNYKRRDAVSLTTNPNVEQLAFFSPRSLNYRVRLTLNVDGLAVQRWPYAFRQHGGREIDLYRADETGVGRRNWYVHFGTIPTDRIIDIQTPNSIQLAGQSLLDAIRAERERAIELEYDEIGCVCRLKPGVVSTWLAPLAA